MPSSNISIMFFSRAGMRLSSLAAVEEFVPPRARHWRGLVGGAVGNAVTVELLETFSVAGRAVAFDTFTGCLRHGYESPGMWGPSIVRPMGRGGWRFDLCRGYSHLHEGMCGVMEQLY